ncbi:ECF RNA polymerase sigma factor SigK [Glaciihabitans sp. INWT7]|uniref:ECF RNA polymerase sigma factor SigK n=1 Tax=Glaciihabitans sp. INWT7 TaxID=2596912 RepID=UPI00162AAC56|nr:ECF RNA polymerase sigma factor SigK [Glaciihabitans sp. INWT7]
MTIQPTADSESVSLARTVSNDLLGRVAAGDHAAFRDLYDALAPRVHGLIRRTLVDDGLSQEVTQDVFFEVWRSASRFDSARGSAVSWIMMMAHGRAVDRVRASQASRDRDLRVGVRDREVNFDPVSEAGELSAESARVTVAMARLTAIQRDAISMTYFEGLSGPELAARLQIPVGTLKSRLREALIRLRDELGIGATLERTIA